MLPHDAGMLTGPINRLDLVCKLLFVSSDCPRCLGPSVNALRSPQRGCKTLEVLPRKLKEHLVLQTCHIIVGGLQRVPVCP